MLKEIAMELCTIRYPDDKDPTKCKYEWDLMPADHRLEFLRMAEYCIKLVIKELDNVQSSEYIDQRINELRQISA